MTSENTLGIYIHVPFCARKCSYCDFYSVNFRKNTAEEFVNAVIRNIVYYSDFSKITDTIYFGGGTPSLLTGTQISSIISEIARNFRLSENTEITLEANPDTLTEKKLTEFYGAGVNRISIGVQSLKDSELKFLGRLHSAERAEKAVNDAYKVGFRNISCDIMTALPNQSTESLEYSLNRITELPVTHISAYILKAEENTPFFADKIRSTLPDDDTVSEIYLRTVQVLESKGFYQYEVSNFAKYGYESRHNCRYWKCLDYIGIGPSAHSCYKGKRFATDPSLAEFISDHFQSVKITDPSPCGFEEYAMLRLRLKSGLDTGKFPERSAELLKKVPALVSAGYAEYKNNVISLTPKGFLVSNSVIEYLIF